MTPKTRLISIAIIFMSSLFLVVVMFAAAQDATPDAPVETCTANLRQLFAVASERCLGKPEDLICNGGWPPTALPTGPAANSLASQGALVPINALTMVNTPSLFPDGSHGGLAWLRVAETHVDALLLGDTRVEEVPLEGEWPEWWSMIVQTSEAMPECPGAPLNSFVLQSNIDFDQRVSTRAIINGVSVDLRGTLVIHTRGDQTIFTAIEGEARIIANGQTRGMVAGQAITTEHEPDDFSVAVGTPSIPQPFDRQLLLNFPVQLLDRPTILPEPGFVATEGRVNMRAQPNLGGELLYEIPEGQIMTILGRNPSGDWYHVRLATGETGWMFADLLRRSHGELQNVYSRTPVPPQRFGEIGTEAMVAAPSAINVHDAPDPTFQRIGQLQPATEVELLARSPYSPWVKVAAGEIEGWVALIALDTRSIIWSLPVDYDVPPQPQPTAPPPPTRVPGSWGGAFPDPSCFPSC